MFTNIIRAILGAPQEGQRKMALGTYLITGLLVILVFCVCGIFFAGLGVDGARVNLLQLIADALITGLVTTFGLLVAGNGMEHFAKRGQPKQ